MKISLLPGLCALAFALPAWSQTPTLSPTHTPEPNVAAAQTPSGTPTISVSPAVSPLVTPDTDEDFDSLRG